MAESTPDYECDYANQQTHYKSGKERKRPLHVVECSVCHARLLDGSLKCYHTMKRVFCERCMKAI